MAVDMTQEAMALATAMIEQFNQRDYDAMIALWGDGQVDYTDVALAQRMTDADSFVAYMQSWVTAFSDVRGTVTSAARDGDLLAYEVRWDGTHDGPLQHPAGAIPASGNHLTNLDAFFVRIDGQRVTQVRQYGDTLSTLSQIGAVPAQGAAPEAAATARA